MQVITSKICIIRNICMIQIFEYLESNNYAMQAMQGGYAMLCKYIRVYASIQISWIFFWYSTMLNFGVINTKE